MASVSNTKLSFSKYSNTEWDVTVKGNVDFNSGDAGLYRLSINLFAEDKEGPIFLNRSPIYTFLFSHLGGSIFLGARKYKSILAIPGESLEFDETRRIDREVLDEDPGVRVFPLPVPPYRISLPNADEIYAVVSVSQLESSEKSETQSIVA